MSDVTVAPIAAPITIDPSSGQAAPAATSAPASAVAADEKPSWLDARLERERRSLLKELGLESLDDGKAKIAALKAEEDAKKSAAQKAIELEAALKTNNAKTKELEDALSTYAKAQLAALTDSQRAAVAAVAGDNPAAQLKTIEVLRPTWAAPQATAPAAAEKLKDTAPAPSAPKDAESRFVTAPDIKAIHDELKKTNPVLAARYALANGVFQPK